MTELGLDGCSRDLLAALLRSTPVAKQGQMTMIPSSDVLEMAGGDIETVKNALQDLARTRRIGRSPTFVFFRPLDEFEWREGGKKKPPPQNDNGHGMEP